MALFLNILVPGAGLIVRGRHWLGFALAMLFALAANAAVAGWLVAPMAIPPVYTWVATVLAALTWLLAQVSLLRQSSPTAPD